LSAPSLFPFNLDRISANQVANLSERVDVVRHGVDENLLMLSEKIFG
jgi:hypothetical protein